MIKEAAYAKVNLFLEVRDKREDGYHNIESVMQSVSLVDDIYMERSEKTSFACNADELCTKNNICFKAARAFGEAFGKGSARIILEKNIPWGAGLGGGSADAAAVLRGLAKIYHLDVPEKDIMSVAAKIGADVPFCIGGGTALCRGIGEKIKPIKPLENVYFVIAAGSGKISTPEAYKKIDGLGNYRHKTPKKVLSAIESGDYDSLCASLFNRFEFLYEKDGRYRIMSEKSGGVIMSGSGSAVYGIYKVKEDAEYIKAALEKNGVTAYIATPVGKI